MPSSDATPVYRRTQLWRPASRHGARPVVLGVLFAAGVFSLVAHAASRACPPTMSRAERARVQVVKLAHACFPEWQIAHRGACPHRLDEVAGHAIDTLDPWGRAFRYTCDPELRAGTRGGIAITSAGEDGVFGTADDIGSELAP